MKYTPSALPSDNFAYNIIREMIQAEPENRMKLSAVVEILNKVKDTRIQQGQQQDPNVIRQHGLMEPGRLYSWDQWNMTLKDGQLYVWSDRVAIEGISERDIETGGPIRRILLNESDNINSHDYGLGIPIGIFYLNTELCNIYSLVTLNVMFI